MKKALGFTLIELMIVVAVIAILAVLAIGQYSKQVRKSRRAEAKQAISAVAMAQEKYRMNNAAYGTCDQIFAPSTCASYNSSLNAYTITVTNNTAVRYTVTATPKTADQLKDSCGAFVSDTVNGVSTKTPTTTGCWQ